VAIRSERERQRDGEGHGDYLIIKGVRPTSQTDTGQPAKADTAATSLGQWDTVRIPVKLRSTVRRIEVWKSLDGLRAYRSWDIGQMIEADLDEERLRGKDRSRETEGDRACRELLSLQPSPLTMGAYPEMTHTPLSRVLAARLDETAPPSLSLPLSRLPAPAASQSLAHSLSPSLAALAEAELAARILGRSELIQVVREPDQQDGEKDRDKARDRNRGKDKDRDGTGSKGGQRTGAADADASAQGGIEQQHVAALAAAGTKRDAPPADATPAPGAAIDDVDLLDDTFLFDDSLFGEGAAGTPADKADSATDETRPEKRQRTEEAAAPTAAAPTTSPAAASDAPAAAAPAAAAAAPAAVSPALSSALSALAAAVAKRDRAPNPAVRRKFEAAVVKAKEAVREAGGDA